VATDVPLSALVTYAYDLEPAQVEGGPTWMRTEFFDIVATPPSNAPSGDPAQTVSTRTRAMLRTLLADRFKLVAHVEKKNLPAAKTASLVAHAWVSRRSALGNIEQLGLRLESTTVPIDVLVVERAEMPIAN